MIKRIPQKIIKKINKKICNIATGIYNDEYWAGVVRVHKELDIICAELNIDIINTTAQYQHENGFPVRKQWITVIRDEKERESIVIVIACGAGSVKDPLDKYDIIAYAT